LSLTGAHTIMAAPVAGGASTVLSSVGFSLWATGGSNVVLEDNVKIVGNNWIADIVLVDVAGAKPRKTLAAQAFMSVKVAPDRAHAVFDTPSGSAPGLYAAPTQ
jgi:hypothetical protein